MNEARRLALEVSFDDALQLLDELISANPTKVDPLLMKGNIIAMFASDDRISTSEHRALDAEREKCIRKALKLKPTCVTALIDMADLLAENTDDPNEKTFARAVKYYDRASALLKAGKPWLSLKDELEELEISKGIFMAKFQLEKWHNQAL